MHYSLSRSAHIPALGVTASSLMEWGVAARMAELATELKIRPQSVRFADTSVAQEKTFVAVSSFPSFKILAFGPQCSSASLPSVLHFSDRLRVFSGRYRDSKLSFIYSEFNSYFNPSCQSPVCSRFKELFQPLRCCIASRLDQ